MSTFIKLKEAISWAQVHTYFPGGVDEIPHLLASFSYLLANLLARIHTVLNGACLFLLASLLCIVNSPLYLSFPGKIHQDSRADLLLSGSGFNFVSLHILPQHTSPPEATINFLPRYLCSFVRRSGKSTRRRKG